MAKSIKLSNNTYWDSTGITVDSSGTTLATKMPVTLYENSSGTSSSFTLSDSIANYSEIEVFYISGGWLNSSAKFYVPGAVSTGYYVALLTNFYGTGTYNVTVHTEILNFSGTTVSIMSGRSRDATLIFSSTSGTPTYTVNTSPSFLITKVIGYK